MKKNILFIIFLCFTFLFSEAQTYSGTIAPALPFLDMSPNTEATAMQVGTGVGDDCMPYYNIAKTPMLSENLGVAIGYSQTLSQVFKDAHLLNVQYYQKNVLNDAFLAGISYYTIGSIFIKDEFGNETAQVKPHDVSAYFGYVKSFSNGTVASNDKLIGSGLGFLLRYYRSTTLNGVNSQFGNGSSVNGVAANLSYYSEWLHKGNDNKIMSWGITLNNLGPKVNYYKNSDAEGNFLPASVRVGFGSTKIMGNSKLTFGVDISKLLVPSVPEKDSNGIITSGKEYNRSVMSSWFTSLADAPEGFGGEIKEFQIAAGGEYFYNDKIFLRAGVNLQSKQKGNNSSITFGGGYRAETFGNKFDLSAGYRQSFNTVSDIANTFFLGLNYRFHNN